MSNTFSKFENFGSIADPAKRKELAIAIYEHLQKKNKKRNWRSQFQY
jgi:dsDNA-specific endonuclease/ATPase MutS2